MVVALAETVTVKEMLRVNVGLAVCVGDSEAVIDRLVGALVVHVGVSDSVGDVLCDGDAVTEVVSD